MSRIRRIEKPKDFRNTVRKLSGYVRPFYLLILLSLVLMVISTVMCIIGPKWIGNVTTMLAEGVIARHMQTGGIDFVTIGRTVINILILYVISAIMDYVVNLLHSEIALRISQKMRNEIAVKINKLPLKYFDRQRHGDVLSRITNDVDTVSNQLTNSISRVLNSLVNIVGVLAMMLVISWKLTLVSLIVVPLSGLLAALIVKLSQRYFLANQRYLGALNGHIEEIYGGHQIVKIYNYEEKALKDFDEINDDLYNAAYKSQFFSSILHPLTGFIGNIGYVCVCLIGGFEVIGKRMKIGDIQSFVTYVRRLNQPINSISQLMNMIQSMVAAAERVFEILDEPEEEADREDCVSVYDENGNIRIQGDVQFDHVRFGYEENRTVIKDFTLDIPAGTDVAIVGATGAGKTTLVKLMMRFYELNGGAILIDGIDIRNYRRHELRECFGMVLQDAWQFEGTIRENIRFSKPDASDKEVEEACVRAHVDHFIRTLDKGYDTEVNEDSSAISQGQKQLLTIARAFLKDPRILILDEATSSVDTRTEQLIQESMEQLRKGRTAFTIAHRLSTIRNADLIIVIDEGDIVEVGKHEELLAKNGLYAKLYNSQFELAEQ